jgi:tRNA(Arg) A34 adenosine deaminase TadA
VDLDERFMYLALEQAQRGLYLGHGGPFGALVVRRNEIIGQGWNQVIHLNDPTAHAEILAIREACQNVRSYRLSDCVLYATCQPCPMCMSAAYWAHIDRLVFAADAEDAAAIGFSDRNIELEIAKPLQQRSMPSRQLLRHESLQLFQQWLASDKRIEY